MFVRRLFRGRSLAFDQSVPGQPVKAQVWDGVMTWGTKRKAGQDSTFDELTLGQIVNNFRSRKNLIGMDYEHQTANASENGQPAPQLAFYSALAIIRNGKVIDFATRDESVQPPDTTDKADGLYAFRAEVTPLGQQLLPNYRYISPMFDTEGLDEQEQPIGYDLLNISAVSVPFQDGCEITFQRLGKTPGKLSKGKMKMDELRKFLGLDDDATMDDVYSACLKRFKKLDDDAASMKKKFDDDTAAMKKKFDDDTAAMAKKMDDATPDGIMDDSDVMADDADDADAMQKMAKVLGFNGKTTPRKMAAALSAKMVPMSDVSKIRQELDALKAEREAEKKADQEKVF